MENEKRNTPYTFEELEKIKIGSKKWREVGEYYEYAPMELSFKDTAAFQIWIGIRFGGKTWGVSNEIIKHFKETGKKTLILYETLNEIQDSVDLTSFGSGHEEEYYDDIEGTKSTVYQKELVDSTIDEKTGLFVDTYEKKEIITVAAISKSERLKPKSWKEYDIVWQDEIFKLNYLKNASFKLTDIFTTTQRTNKNWKFIATGNALSINAPIFRALNINSLSKNIVTTIKNEKGEPYIRIINWMVPVDILEERFGHLASFQLAKKNGYFDYAFKNIMKFDDEENVEVLKKSVINKLDHVYTFKIEDNLIVDMKTIPASAFEDKRQRFYLIENKEKNPIVSFAISREFSKDNIKLRQDISKQLSEWLTFDLLKYETITIKQAIWEICKRYF